MKDIAVKVDGTTTLPAVKFNSMVDELENSIVDTGQTLEGDPSTDKQMQIAMATYASGGDYYTDSGSANAYALNIIGSKQSPHVYFDGMIVRFRPTNANSGASTVNINSLGLKDIVYQDGTTALAGGSLVTTHDALIRYSTSVGKFILLNNNINDLLDVDTTGAVDGSILQRNASGVWVVALGEALPTNYINGLICENASGDTDHDITLNTGKCRDFADTINISVGSAITKQIDANWADGTNNGGFPSSITLTADTDYYYFVISKPDGTANAGFDSSLTATNLLDVSNAGGAGYTKYRRVDAYKTDGSSNIKPKKAFELAGGGIEVVLDVPSMDAISVACPATASLVSLETPTGIKTIAKTSISINSVAGTLYYGLWSSPNISDNAPSVSLYNIAHSQNSSANIALDPSLKPVWTNTSSQGRIRFNVASGLYTVITEGYTDTRLT